MTKRPEQFKNIIAQYPWAQCFDPSRGAYWSVAEKSQSSIDVMEGKNPLAAAPVKKAPRTIPVLKFPGRKKLLIGPNTANFSTWAPRIIIIRSLIRRV